MRNHRTTTSLPADPLRDPLRAVTSVRPSRRGLLCGTVAAAAATGPATGLARALGRGPTDHTLVLVTLRGGLDGLAACVPTFEGARLAALRPSLLVPTSAAAGAVDVGGSFVLHPALGALAPLVSDGHLAVVHAVGFGDPTRSHFAARDLLEAGAPGALGAALRTGWVARALETVPSRGVSAPRAISLGSVLPRVLQRAERAVAVNDPGNFASYGNTATSAARRATLRTMALAAAGAPAGTLVSDLAAAASNTLDAFETIGALDFGRTPGGGANYPSSLLGERLHDAATIARARIGTEVIHMETGDDWDDHDDMGPVGGALAARLDDLGRALMAFRTDLGPDWDRTTVVVSSEFGRRVDQNGSGGTDHGRAGVAFVLGGAVLGGVYGTWPGLGPDELDGGALRVTTDLRAVYSEVLEAGFGATALGQVFPNFSGAQLGLF